MRQSVPFSPTPAFARTELAPVAKRAAPAAPPRHAAPARHASGGRRFQSRRRFG
jgi:hypothetical protein